MSSINIESQVFPILAEVNEPLTGQDLLSLEAVSQVQCLDGHLSCKLTLGYPGESYKEVVTSLGECLAQLDDVEKVSIDATWQAPTNASVDGKKPIANVRNVIAVASGKGGVGKSTTTANLALAMSALGARVGVLDADIYGPSQAKMLGTEGQKPEIRDQKAMIPIMAHGVQTMSMAYLLSDNTPAVWRGPMATGALQQMIFQTDWDDLDYLFVDMPPGTGDIQLTLSQQVPVSGAVIVTTPQDIALLDAKKAIEMFAKVNIPVLGVIENMAVHNCSQCGHEEHIFGKGGGERIASDYNTQMLAALPLALSIREHADSGNPSVLAEPESRIAQHYNSAALQIAASLWQQQLAGNDLPEIAISDD
ncbi:MAG: iron-sulfur cluster carrier protein ApbC [Cellvibrionaceae bacterium]